MMRVNIAVLVAASITALGCKDSERERVVDQSAGSVSRVAERSSGKPTPEPFPDGRDLLDTLAAEWQVGEWHGGEARTLASLRDRVVVVRFWTDTCPHCARSLPALQNLAEELRDQPVTFVGLYHSKPRGSERPWATAVARARELGVRFPVAYDHDWKTVTRWWIRGGTRRATSATFVIDKEGRIAHVHPGPALFPSDRAEDAEQNRGYLELRAAIDNALSKGA